MVNERREIPGEVFDREIEWPAPAPEPREPRAHRDRIPDDAPGPYRRPHLAEPELEADSEGGEPDGA
jgi:hypothetical protein